MHHVLRMRATQEGEADAEAFSCFANLMHNRSESGSARLEEERLKYAQNGIVITEDAVRAFRLADQLLTGFL